MPNNSSHFLLLRNEFMTNDSNVDVLWKYAHVQCINKHIKFLICCNNSLFLEVNFLNIIFRLWVNWGLVLANKKSKLAVTKGFVIMYTVPFDH